MGDVSRSSVVVQERASLSSRNKVPMHTHNVGLCMMYEYKSTTEPLAKETAYIYIYIYIPIHMYVLIISPILHPILGPRWVKNETLLLQEMITVGASDWWLNHLQWGVVRECHRGDMPDKTRQPNSTNVTNHGLTNQELSPTRKEVNDE